MPRSWKPRRGGKRRMPRKMAYRRRAKKLVNNAITPLPQRFITKHKYSTTITINTATPQYNFNLNSLFDPDRTSTGHQPYGFDQLSALYNRYRVYGCSYVVTGYQANNPIRIGVVPSNSVAALTNMASLIELPRAKFTTQIPGGPRAQVKGYVDLPSLTGRTKSQYSADDIYSGTALTDPSELLILNIRAALLSDLPVDGCLMTVTLQYHCEWYDPIVFATS